jgi:acetolactate synthase-1/2/3 large subunit
MVTPITKFAKKIESVEDLVNTLPKALGIALEGRMGPVLLDIPMNIQQAEISSAQRALKLSRPKNVPIDFGYMNISEILKTAQRPVVLIGAGAALSGTAPDIQNWCEKYEIPHVSSWGAMAYLDRSAKNYFGSIGVYGARGANWLVQACDELLVLGSRLDNRQRTGNPNGFAPFANICVLDIDKEELAKYKTQSNYKVYQFDLREVSSLLESTQVHKEWASFARESTSRMADGFDRSVKEGLFNPYYAVRLAQEKFDNNAIVVSDCGANLCWVYQSYQPDDSFLFTAGGNSPMGYSLPAAIGAQLSNPSRPTYCFIGDGGLQMNLQELQTIVHYKLPIKIFIQNNLGYGIIKQFQDAYFEGRYFATGQGYSVPNFAKIAQAFGIPYQAVTSENQMEQLVLPDGFCIIDILLPPESLITPKTEMNRFIHDQFPYIEDDSISKLPYDYPEFPSLLRTTR